MVQEVQFCLAPISIFSSCLRPFLKSSY
jgi:hypothetical protein